MAVGLPMKTTYANGDVLQASDVNDITGTVNLVGQTTNLYAGKNKIINGDFGVWQRGTSFTTPSSGSYTSDRWAVNYNGTGSTRTISRQTFTPGTAPVSGYESSFFYRYAQSVAGTLGTFSNFATRLEDVRLLAGQTATLSYWAKADATRAVTPNIEQNFGSGGSSPVYTTGTSVNLTTSWVRYSQTFTVPSISGKTIGTSSFLAPYFDIPINSTFTIDIWGVQLEAGSTATAFQTATGTIQGELAACQRYYIQLIDGSNAMLTNACAYSSSEVDGVIATPVPMRGTPTLVQTTGTDYWAFLRNNGSDTFNSLTYGGSGFLGFSNAVDVYNNTEISSIAGHAGFIRSNNALTKLGLSAEL
jgi:hypothetical protein